MSSEIGIALDMYIKGIITGFLLFLTLDMIYMYIKMKKDFTRRNKNIEVKVIKNFPENPEE